MMSHKPPWSLIMAMVVMMVSASSNNDMEGDCRVEYRVRTDDPGAATLPLLAYVSRSTNVTLGFLFRDVDASQERDAVCLNSTGATHSVVRGGRATWTPMDLPRLIPEGWNTFRVAVTRQGATMTLVQGLDQLTLLTLPLPRPVTTVIAEGTVARCPTLSPEWEVAAGGEVEVVLQPGGSEHDQWMEVSSGEVGDAGAYLSFPSSLNTKCPVPPNAILRITNSLRGDHALLRVFKVGEGDGEEMVEERVSITPPLTMVVGSGGGSAGGDGPSIHLRLMLTPPRLYASTSATGSSRSAGAAALGVSIALVVVAVLCVSGAVLYCQRHRLRNYLLLRKKQRDSMVQVTPETLASLSRRPDFEGRLTHSVTNGVQSLRLQLLPDKITGELLKTLRENDTSKVELLLVSVPEASKFHTSVERLPVLPDVQKVKLMVAGFREKDVATVCRLVTQLQPSHGYAIVDFRGDGNSMKGGDGVLSEEAWARLLKCLHEEEVTVKGKVLLPKGSITEERRRLLPLRFTYECCGDDHSVLTYALTRE